MKQPDFLICAPLQAAGKSNGIQGLISLAKTIERLGRSAFMCQIVGENDEYVCTQRLQGFVTKDPRQRREIDLVLKTAEDYGINLLDEFSRDRIDSSYVVYPEAVLGNPLGAKNVVRYFLNRDGSLKGGAKVAAGPTDFILAHSRVMHPTAQHVCFFSQMNPLFNRVDTLPAEHRRIDLAYVGKGSLYGFAGKIDGTVAITRNWPERKEELAILLRNCRFFYTADACSNINNEALACGAIPVFVHNGPWTDAEIDGFEPGPLPRVRLSTPPGGNFFAEFEIARERYLSGLQACEHRWEPSVRELIDKVDRHFSMHSTSPSVGAIDLRRAIAQSVRLGAPSA